MAFQLTAGEPPAEGIQRIVRKELKKALDQLTSPAGDKQLEVVHDVRKRFKKVRAVLRLVRDEIGPRVYQRENLYFRDAGRPLTEVRDAQALVETLDKLAKHFGQVDAPAVAGVRRALQAHLDEVRRRVLEEEGAFARLAEVVREARDRVWQWGLVRAGWSTLGRGLKRVYQAGYRARAEAAFRPTAENLHEWRKQVKYLWHQLQILEPVRTEEMKTLADHAHELADYLGDDHDLVVLGQTLQEDPVRYRDRAAVANLLDLVERRRGELQQEAYFLGRQVYGTRPRALVKRLKGYWRAWWSGAEAPVQRTAV
jgi:CHAD domain-containing protein